MAATVPRPVPAPPPPMHRAPPPNPLPPQAAPPPQGPPPAAGAPQAPPAGYQQPAYGGPQTESTATVALVLSILSFFTVYLFLAVVALVLANVAKQRIAASGGQLSGEGAARWATILAWVNIILSVLAMVGFVVFLALD